MNSYYIIEARRNLVNSYLKMAGRGQSQLKGIHSRFVLKHTSPKHKAAEHKHLCCYRKINKGGKLLDKKVTTIFFASVYRQKVQHLIESTFLDHQVIQLITSTKENAFPTYICFCHLQGDELYMTAERKALGERPEEGALRRGAAKQCHLGCSL